MRFDPERHHRRSIRLPKYDYTRVGAYFVTICAHQRACRFGRIEKEAVELGWEGDLVSRAWRDLPVHFPHATLDAFIVMPNHVHGILVLEIAEGLPRRHGLSEILRAFKSYSSSRINAAARTPGRPVWQRNYYERILRNDHELNGARRYITENPARWPTDPENQPT